MTQLRACYFESVGSGASRPGRPSTWRRMARVLEASARHHLPAWDVRLEALPLTVTHADATDRAFLANTHKLQWWVAQVDAAADGDQLLLIDADTLILRPLDDVWDLTFDLAYTVRPPRDWRESLSPARFPFNGGVVFVRVSDRTRAAMAAWLDHNTRLLEDPARHARWRYRYGGMNQAAFGWMLETGGFDGLQLRQLPCAVWNCEESAWPELDRDHARILHIKGALRLACFHPFARTPAMTRVANLWIDAERTYVPTP